MTAPRATQTQTRRHDGANFESEQRHTTPPTKRRDQHQSQHQIKAALKCAVPHSRAHTLTHSHPAPIRLLCFALQPAVAFLSTKTSPCQPHPPHADPREVTAEGPASRHVHGPSDAVHGHRFADRRRHHRRQRSQPLRCTAVRLRRGQLCLGALTDVVRLNLPLDALRHGRCTSGGLAAAASVTRMCA